MATKIGINGFGRIGRCVLRALHQRGGEGLEVAAINDLTDTAMLGHLLQYDTVHRTFDAKVEVGDKLRVEVTDIDNRGKISLIPVVEESASADVTETPAAEGAVDAEAPAEAANPS